MAEFDRYTSPGTENLRAEPHVYDGEDKEQPGSKEMSGRGEDGTENKRSDHQVLSKAFDRPMPTTYSKDNRPAGVQHFNGEGV